MFTPPKEKLPLTFAPPPDVTLGEEPVNLLLVDDDVRNLDVLESILNRSDYRFVRALSAEEALLALMSEDFAVIILDIRMPGMNGLELAQAIKQRKKTKDIPIIFLTAYYQEDEQVVHGYDAGAVDYLNKPCNPIILRSKVSVFVNLFRQTRVLHAEIKRRKLVESEIARAIEREQLRLGQELHDGLGQQLTGINYVTQALAGKLGKHPALAREAKRLHLLVQQSLEQSRNLAKMFYPVELERLGLLLALQEITDKIPSLSSGILYSVESDGDPCYATLKGQHAIQLFRIAQESVHNAIKHSGAKQICVRLETTEEMLTLTIKDDGKGLQFNLDESKGLGFHIMQYRAGLIGAGLDIRNAPEGGVVITCSLPRKLLDIPVLPTPMTSVKPILQVLRVEAEAPAAQAK